MKLRANRVLSLDVGLAHLGYVVWTSDANRILEAGVITTKKHEGTVSSSNKARCEFLVDNLVATIRSNQIRYVVAELPTGGAKSSKAAVAMSLSFGTVVAAIRALGIPLYGTTPMMGKRVVLPSGSVSKKQVQRYVEREYGAGVLPKTAIREHVADAVVAMVAWKKKNSHEPDL